MIKNSILFLVSMWISIGCANANTIKVYIDFNNPDSVGQQLSYYIKDTIRKSSLLDLTYDKSDSAIGLKIVTLNPNEDFNKNQTIYSFTILLKNGDSSLEYYLDSGVGICGSSKLQSCALGIVTNIDSWADAIRTNHANREKADSF